MPSTPSITTLTEQEQTNSPPRLPAIPKLAREGTDLTLNPHHEKTSKESITLSLKRTNLHPPQHQFRNSLLTSAGFLELSNAADFAANVWNDIPVPTFAAILMGIGGTIALLMTSVAVRDFRLSLRNVRLLRRERSELLLLHRLHADPATGVQSRLRSARLGVQQRELGTEIVDRLVMDALMGTGCVLVGAGTIMAIGGADDKVFKASNLMSGYIGNAVTAVYGVVNAGWSGVVVWRFWKQSGAVKRRMQGDGEGRSLQRLLLGRMRAMQWHAVLNGVTGLVAGAASMVTATRWWGYVVLIPCIVSFILCNAFWRLRLGYDRPVFSAESVSGQSLCEQLEYVIGMQRALRGGDGDVEDGMGSVVLVQKMLSCGSLENILRFIVQNRLLENYICSMTRDKKMRVLLKEALPVDEAGHMVVAPEGLVQVAGLSPENLQTLLEHARRFLRKDGVDAFVHRERHILEMLAYSIWKVHVDSDQQDELELRQL